MNGQMIRGQSAMNQDAGAKYAEPIAAMPPIPGALDRLMSAVMNLDGNLGTLHDRLHRVLRDAPPAKEGATGIGSAPPVSSQTYQQIEMQTARLEQMTAFVRDIMDRLEA